MECAAVFGFLFLACLPVSAEPVGRSPEENKAQYPAVAANFNLGKPVREGAMMQLADFVKNGDTLLKERLQASYTDLKEQLKQGDSLLKERMLEGEVQLKEQLKDGDGRMKEELDDDVEYLKDKLNKEQERVKEEFADEESKFTSEMSDLKEAFAKLQDSFKTWTKSSSSGVAVLQRQMEEVQVELNNTKELLGSTKQKAETTEQELHRTRQELQTAQAEVGSLKAEVDGLQSSHRPSAPGAIHVGEANQAVSDTGSTFTRWGRTVCPGNSALVYSGVAGGSFWNYTGGASNYLCLVRDPQLDNETAVPSSASYLYGAEYQNVEGHHDQDVVCAVCRAPHPTSIMIPATLTCPDGWTSQYKGHLMSGHHSHRGRFEYVCMDELRENDHGGHANANGALFYHVLTRCGSLPCPPYTNNLITTCVVCSQ